MPEISESLKPAKTQLAKTGQIEDVAAAFNMPVNLAHALDLDAIRDDGDRATQLNVNIRTQDVWQFSGFREIFGHEYPGRIPGDLLFNALFQYTKQNDLILDPMAGSGTTADVCLLMDRRCYCYDVVNQYDRPEIRDHDLYRDGWPPRTEQADLIFWDPPYFQKMDGKQIGEEDGYGEKSISRLDRTEYLGFFLRAFKLAHETTKATCKIAFLMGGWYDYDVPADSIFRKEYTGRIEEAGWTITREIDIPQGMHQRPHLYNKLRNERRMASATRYLLIAEKT